MARHIELNPVTHLTVGTIGPPGRRTFYLQGSQGSQTISLVIEKVPWLAISLSVGMLHLTITDLGVSDLPGLSLLERGAVATVSYAGYLVRLVWPLDLACWYPHPAVSDQLRQDPVDLALGEPVDLPDPGPQQHFPILPQQRNG